MSSQVSLNKNGKGENIDRREGQCDYGERGCSGATRNWKWQADSSLKPPEGVWLGQHLDFGLTAFTIIRE